MPVSISKTSSGGYRVSTPNMVHAKNTSKANAMKQQRILNAVEHTSWRPSSNGRMRKRKSSGMKMFEKHDDGSNDTTD